MGSEYHLMFLDVFRYIYIYIIYIYFSVGSIYDAFIKEEAEAAFRDGSDG